MALEIKKKARKGHRSAYTKLCNELEAALAQTPVVRESVDSLCAVLERKLQELQVYNKEIYDLMTESASDEDLATESTTCDAYAKKFLFCQAACSRLEAFEERNRQDASSDRSSSSSSEAPGRRKFKLPRIEFKHYDGGIKDWLSFWAQFKKVHDDDSIDESDKIEYLTQATVPGSRARRLVESYPALSENYPKIIEGMQSRFGREDLQIEYYVRELLKLILSNATSNKKMDIVTLYDQIETQLRALDTLGITADKCSALLFPLVESCLSHELLVVWQRSAALRNVEAEESLSTSLDTRLRKLLTFLKSEVENEQRVKLATEGFGFANSGSSGKSRIIPTQIDSERPTASALINSETKCVFCSGLHRSDTCFKAQKMSLDKKKEALSDKRACFRCLKVNHPSRQCRERLRCMVCSKSHLVLMCPELHNDKVSKSRESPADETLANHTTTHVFLQTLRLNLVGRNKNKSVRALIDSGSHRSYILRETTNYLGYRPKRVEKIMHCLFGGREVLESHNCFDVQVLQNGTKFTFESLDQKVICGDVPPVFYGPWSKELQDFGITLSDSLEAGPIELLLGSDILGKLYTGERKELPCGLMAFETKFGWTLVGETTSKQGSLRADLVATTLSLFTNDVSCLWELDVLGIKEPSDKNSKDEMAAAAKDLFLQTVNVNEEGRYEVRLPWLEDHPVLPSNYKLAQKRLTSTLTKLKNIENDEAYGNIFKEWEKEGIIERVDSSANFHQGHFLPHRPVFKENSLTTKIRPVFDASAHEKGQPSLNHCLEKGPNMIELIPSILLRFREHKIGVTADIRKAFLQISVHPKDREFLQFLWTDKSGRQMIYRHKRVVFGLNSSPFLLAATLEYHLRRCFDVCGSGKCGYSRATVESLTRGFYVDNCVTSVPDVKHLVRFMREADLVMKKGQFDLREWEHTRYTGDEWNDHPSNIICPVLGLDWDPKRDTMRLNHLLLSDISSDNDSVTKRYILSMAQKIFDPIGFLCPAVLVPKLILQGLWKENVSWDQPIDETNSKAFRAWLKDVHNLFKIEVPRWMHMNDCAEDVSLHVFCDASQSAYACVIFLRVAQRGQVNVTLLSAKARVAPTKKSSSKMTIPRLELLAATIGSRLYNNVKASIEREIEAFFWTDSSTVLSWIQRQEEWGVFVWNRVNEIRMLTPAKNWRHLPGSMNPADLPSRGCSPKQLLDSKWWEGPNWLYGPHSIWPSTDAIFNEEEIRVERKKKLVTSLVSVECSSSLHLDYFSSYNKTVRMIAWIYRFIHNCKNLNSRTSGELTSEEYDNAERFILKRVQTSSFKKEDDAKIKCLRPVLGDDGLLRLKTKVSNRPDMENFRFPILLPAKQPLVEKLIMSVHQRECHAGTQCLLGLLRENFWILGGRRTIRRVISRCVPCRRQNSKPLTVETPALPLDRVREAVAFEVTGVDFAGPLFLKDGRKVWICLFTCAVYRAVHLELSLSLSSSCFLKALRRFVARRGRPKTIYSDNGTNFVGAENALASVDWDTIVRETAIQKICWKFNPPTAAWWGGFWERLIGLLKGLLRKVLGRACLDYDDLVTVLCDCESVINARPLTYLSDDPNDLVPLSPQTFLRERADSGLPDCDALDGASLCRKLRKLQRLREDLRNRFRVEYLGQLKLYSGKSNNRTVAVGELVLVGNTNSKRLEWPVGRVTEMIPGKDGTVRLAKIQTIKGQLLRPVQRLYPLECCSESEHKVHEVCASGIVQKVKCSEQPLVVCPGSAPVSREVTTRSGRVSKVPTRFCV